MAISHEACLSFADLVESVRADDQEAIRALYNRYAAQIKDAIRLRFLPPRNPLRRTFDSSDLSQITWIAALEAIKNGASFHADEQFVNFLLVVCRNCYLKEVRAHRAGKRIWPFEGSLEAQPMELAVYDASDEDEAALQEQWQRFLDRTAPVYREVVRMRAAGEPVPRIAERLEMSVRWVYRVLENERQRWLDFGGGEGTR